MIDTSLAKRPDFRALVDQLDGIAMWVVSEPGTYEYISSGFEEIWGIPPDAVRDDPERLLETIHPDDRDHVRSLFEQDATEITAETYEGRVVRPNGEVRWLKTQHVPMRDDRGNFVSLVGISTDITEQKRREEELGALNRLLRHDIRNDMSVVLGWAELLEEHVDEEGEDLLRRILASGEHVVELTKLAREYAETLTDETAMRIVPVDLRPTLERELAIRRETYPDAEFVVEGEIPDVEVRANELLSSVFRNVLNNAVQHNDSATPVVEVSCEERDADVVVAVADNGPGVPDDRKESIFGKGERSIDSAGTGIGLYLVRTILDECGGEVRVTDNDPTGSVFSVTLPKER
jgi:PAS domain S-box-containing protein